MSKKIKLIYLILLLTLNFYCIEKKSSEKEISTSQSVITSKTDSLKFTSGIRSIFQDSKGNYWFGSHAEGVCLFNGKSYKYFTTKDGLSENQVRSIQEDAKGNIWFETANGACSFNGITISKPTAKVNHNAPGSWIKTDIALWFNAGNREVLYRYDGKSLDYLAFPKPENANTNNLFAVTGFSKGKNDMQWIATYAGIFGYNGNQFTMINDATLGLKKETGKLHIRSILADAKGRLWIGNNGIGVLLKEGEKTINFSEAHHLIHPESKRGGEKSPPGTLEHVFVIQEDPEGNIWFGDRDTGPWKFDGNTMTNYTIDAKLSSQMVWCIYNDNKNNLLFGMADGGVYKLTGETYGRIF